MNKECTVGSGISSSYTEEIVCPWCGFVHADSWDFFSGETDGEIEVECHKCGKSFLTNQNIEVTFSTRKPQGA